MSTTNEVRVVITGCGITSPLGNDLNDIQRALENGKSGVEYIEEWRDRKDMITRLGARASLPKLELPRKKTRSMGRVARLAAFATQRALDEAQLSDDVLHSDRCGIVYGSTHGSSAAMEVFAREILKPDCLLTLGSNGYLKFMSHTCAVNLALAFEIRGRVQSTCAACVSSSQAIGFAYEHIRSGRQDVMFAGGAEELHWVSTGVFDVLQITSTAFNQSPEQSPRPFDAKRDGMVVGEGAATLVLERRDHALARGATILGEIIGFGTSADGLHITSPHRDGMAHAMRLALDDAGISADAIDYCNAHATSTQVGDIEESFATASVLGNQCPVSSTKGFTGHTLGACGAIESVISLASMQNGFLPPNHNLGQVDEHCAPLNYVRDFYRQEKGVRFVMNNNFAFGGINTSLIFSRDSDD